MAEKAEDKMVSGEPENKWLNNVNRNKANQAVKNKEAVKLLITGDGDVLNEKTTW